ncbi:site-specific DNA-methyltransferase [Larkinella ripae]
MTNTKLAQKIRTLPGLTDAERSDLLSLLNEKKKYGLVWEEKPEQVEEDLRNKLPVLREVTSRRIVARQNEGTLKKEDLTGQTALNFDYIGSETNPLFDQVPQPPHHLLIEGDNLHALTVLNYTHAGKVDVIYIDPPYNTGNKDFKYNDRFVDREDSYRHSKWLSFMQKRLELARNLLKPEGVIFISIDDNEQAQLKLLCDRVLGEENFVANVIWQKIDSPKNTATHFSDDHEYIIIFAKNKVQWRPIRLPRNVEMIARYKNPDNDSRGPWLLSDMAARNFYSLGKYAITTPSGRIIDGPPAGSYWRISADKFTELNKDNRIWFGPNGSNRPGIKRFLSEVRDGVIPQTLWTWNEVGSTRNSKQEFSQLMSAGANEDLFVTPKPTKLMQRIIQVGAPKNALIFDFFAGSGTTLHAVMALNAEDGGNRQCILVTNNENNIAEEVCFERNRRVIEGYISNKGVAVSGLTNNHLHYYQTAYVDRERTQTNKRDLMRLATELLCIKENCFVETSQLASIRLFTNDLATQHVVIVYDEDAIADAVTIIQDLPHLNPVKVYVFAPGPYPYTDDFEDVLDRIELCALPEAIYQAFGRLLPPQGEPQPVENDSETITASLPLPS